MRKLTIKQKNLLKKWVAEDSTISRVEDLSGEQWDILTAINDTEILYQNVNHFLDNLYMDM